jgi:hypothetical protein
MKDQMVAVDQAANIGIQFQGERPSGPAFIIWSIPTKRTFHRKPNQNTLVNRPGNEPRSSPKGS